MADVYAILMDIVRSRDLADRADAQRRFETVLAEAAEGLGLITVPCATVGDEFQALAPALPEALTLILRIQLLLPEDLDLRFGVGRGRTDLVGGSGPRALQDGSAWWLAREAIDRARALQDGSSAYVRTRYRADDGDEVLVNAFLLLRDHALAGLSPRQRRMLAGLTGGRTQARIAEAEGVSQAAVSQFAVSKGAALLAAHRLLIETTSRRRPRPAAGGGA